MATIVNNLVSSTKSIFNAASKTLVVTTDVVAKGSALLNSSIEHGPAIVGATLRTPFNAAEGYLVADGVEAQEAHERAYRFITQDVSVTIDQAGVALGSGLHSLLTEEANKEG